MANCSFPAPFHLKIVNLSYISTVISPLFVLYLVSPDFATSSLPLHKHVVLDVNNWSSTFASLALSTLAPMFTRVESSLFPGRHVKMISFFCPWHPSAFHLFTCKFLGTYRSDLSDFCLSTTTGSLFIIFPTFGRRIFGRVNSDKNFIFRIFLAGKGYIIDSCLDRKLGNASYYFNRWITFQFSGVHW